MKTPSLLALLLGFGWTGIAKAQLEYVRCEARKTLESDPKKVKRGVIVFFQGYDQNNYPDPDKRIFVRKKWYGQDRERRDAEGNKCWAAVRRYICKVPTSQELGRNRPGRSGESSMVLFDRRRGVSVKDYGKFTQDSLTECLQDWIAMGYNAMQGDVGIR